MGFSLLLISAGFDESDNKSYDQCQIKYFCSTFSNDG